MKKNKNSLFQQFPILSKKDCERAKKGVLNLESQWQMIEREGFLANRRCFRLGSSLEYSRANQKIYLEKAQAMNPLMKENFGWLYKKVTDILSEHLGKPVRLIEGLSCPGFNIVMNDSVFGKYSAPWHTDFDSVFIKWKHPVKVSDIRSFTLPVCLPPAGGTLDMKDLRFDDVFGKETKAELIKRAKIIGRFPHKLGHLFLMDGRQFHRIGMLRPPYNPKEMRITLQGYLIPQRGYWVIHW